MVAASIWSLLLPAMEQAAEMGKWSFVPAVTGFWLGILFCCSWIISYPIYTEIVQMRKVPEASCRRIP